METELTYVTPCFAGKADLMAMEDSLRPNSKVVFRHSIDEAEPETIHISITRQRWETLGKPTELNIRVTND